MGSLPRGRPTCKYETAAAFGRRRILYDIGDAPLEKAKEEPKASLNPDEEDKLSGDMRELYDRLLPTSESEDRRKQLVDKLGRILRKEWPGNDFTVHVFGSSGNMLCTSESDVDICVQTPFKKLETMHQLAEVMATNGMERVICIASAKVPIVKIWDPELKLACDINVNNTLALENTRMIKTYVQIDDRVRPLAMIVKHWTRQRILNDAGLGGTLSSYTWICMILNFLQTRDPPILPALHQREHERYIANDGSEAGFDDNMDALQGFGKENKETLAQLLFHFFRRYGHEIDYDKSVVSVRHGKLLLRSEKSWDSAKEALSRLCVEEPFNTTRNLGNTADATAFRGIHLEIRQAFDYLANGAQLDKLCEPFEFPPEEKNIFKKPTPGARPILPQLPPNMRRNAPAPVSMRAPRNPQGMRSSPGYRRASGGAAFSNMRPPYGYQQQVNYSHHDALEQLRQGFLMKQNQIEALKAQLAAQSHAQQAYAHAQTMQANIAQAQAQVQAGLASPQTQVFMNGPRTPKLGERHSAVYNPYNYSYYPHYDFAQTMALAASQDGTRTNPTSPSLSTVTPATRRGLQRSVTGNGFQSSANRSQSQPARGLPYHILAATGYPPVPTYDPANYATTPPQLNGVNGVDVAQGYSDLPLRSARALSIADSQSNSGSPREYVGYYVDDSPQMAQTQPLPQQKFANFQLPPIPSYGELRKQRVSSDLHPPSSISTRRLSRSPSPLGHMRSFSTASGLRSAPLPSLPLPRQRTDSGQQTAEMNGPLIVNGSYSTAMPSATWEAQSTPSEVQPELNDRFAGNFASTGTAPSSMQSAYDIFGIQQPIETASEASVTDSEHAAAPVQVNGIHSNSPKPPNGIIIASSTPQQSTEPFPPLSRASPESVQSQENHVLTVSPPSAPAIPTRSPWRDVAASKGPVPPLDLSGVSDVPSALSSGKALLSPVMETRTPSPTANRRDGSLKSFKSNGSISMPNGTHAGSSKGSAQYIEQPENTTLANRSNKQHPSRTDAGQGNGASASNQKQQQSGQWQPASKKKKRGRARSNAQKMENGYKAENGPKPGEGEPMPANEAERKGG